MGSDWQNSGFGVYVHWPFCKAKCPYCDFNSHVRDGVDQARWVGALIQEIENTAAIVPGRTVNTIFFGGGTPSLMEPETVASVIDAIGKYWKLADDPEISLEANPTSVEAGRFQGYADAGVNRISMGIQSLVDADLKALGRLHTALEARQAFDIARKIFDNVSFDLIYARQHQTLHAWKLELQEAIEMAVDHFSLYQLTIEASTRFGELHAVRKLRGLPTDTLASDMYLATQVVCGTAGLKAYEISNHARDGGECRHNLNYWRYGDYAGIGPGAHGRLTVSNRRLATETPLSPEDWLSRVESAGTAVQITEEIAPEHQLSEYLMMSMRLSEGSELERIEAMSPGQLDMVKLRELQDEGFLSITNHKLIATQKGRLVLNTLLGEILRD